MNSDNDSLNTDPAVPGRAILVIGGGAAGLLAAIAAARLGTAVTVLERMQRVGKKILATGNGRCNLTNLRPDLGHYHGANPRFALAALEQFDVTQTLSFFEELGVLTRTEDDGKVFPITNQATSVLDVLRYELAQLGAQIETEVNIQKIERVKEGFRCTATDGRAFSGGRVILAAGGKSSPNLGSNGGGYKLAEMLGHSIIEPWPALVQLRLDTPWLKQLDGVKIDGTARLVITGEERKGGGNETEPERWRGELLFTDYGLSGLPALHLSRAVAPALKAGRKLSVSLDLFPDHAEEQIYALIARRVAVSPAKPIELCFVGLLHKRLIPVLLKEADIEDLRPGCGKLTKPDMRRIAARLKDWRIPCGGTQSWMTSQVTAGGVDVRQVDPRTLESKIVPGMFFAGEVLDIDGDCGGYNLQWAWSSGYVAGCHAAE